MIVVQYPASLWPISEGGLSDPTFAQSVVAGLAALPSPQSVAPGTVVSGGSQGAIVASLYKREFNQAWAHDPQNAPAVTFVLIRSEMRPNGGILEHFAQLGELPILDNPFYGART
jgi:hypothetical protein